MVTQTYFLQGLLGFTYNYYMSTTEGLIRKCHAVIGLPIKSKPIICNQSAYIIIIG